METIPIQGTDLRISRVGLGTWAIGGTGWGGTDLGAAVRALHAAVDQGITLIDTAPAYGFGRSEEIVGEALARHDLRRRVVIATKCGLEWDSRGIRRNATPERLRWEVEQSLRRLRTDVIDLYQVHWPDPRVPVEEVAGAMRDLYERGLIRAIGVSNFSPDQMKAFGAVAPLHTAQPPYNLFERGIEADVLPWCREHRVATLTYGVLCRGLLSGRMDADTRFPADDLRRVDPKFRPPAYAAYLEAVHALEDLARRRFKKPVIALAVRWALDQPGVGAVLWGARRPDQLAPLADVLDWHVDDAAKRDIDRLLADIIREPIGPEFMAPPARPEA
jgi:aryl-alcohol dehydrogenase-like predicted oxidoreductase